MTKGMCQLCQRRAFLEVLTLQDRPGTQGGTQDMGQWTVSQAEIDFFPLCTFFKSIALTLPFPRHTAMCLNSLFRKKIKGLWKMFLGNSYLPAFLWQVTLSPVNFSRFKSWQVLTSSPAACYHFLHPGPALGHREQLPTSPPPPTAYGTPDRNLGYSQSSRSKGLTNWLLFPFNSHLP